MIEFIILGIIQGIFEWFPISSEGMVAIVSKILTPSLNPIDLGLFLHLGTLFAVILYFWKDWVAVITLKDKDMFKFLLIATPLSLILGYPLYQLVRNMGSIGSGLLLVVGIGLLLTSLTQKLKLNLDFNTSMMAIVSGILQGLSVVPGLSRSGSTIFGLSLGQIEPREILRKSYMMSVPIVIVASTFLMINQPVLYVAWPAIISSFVVGILTLHYLLKLSKRINFSIFTTSFGILCIIGAILSFVL